MTWSKMPGKHDVLVRLKEDDMEDFKNAIKPLKVSEYFRQHQQDVVEEYRKKKQSPEETLISYIDPTDKKQVTLDLYAMNKSEITHHLDGIRDTEILIQLRDKSRQIQAITHTRLKKL